MRPFGTSPQRISSLNSWKKVKAIKSPQLSATLLNVTEHGFSYLRKEWDFRKTLFF